MQYFYSIARRRAVAGDGIRHKSQVGMLSPADDAKQYGYVN